MGERMNLPIKGKTIPPGSAMDKAPFMAGFFASDEDAVAAAKIYDDFLAPNNFKMGVNLTLKVCGNEELPVAGVIHDAVDVDVVVRYSHPTDYRKNSEDEKYRIPNLQRDITEEELEGLVHLLWTKDNEGNDVQINHLVSYVKKPVNYVDEVGDDPITEELESLEN